MINPPRRSPGRQAFTLIELLTVIAIVGILSAILLSVLGTARARANQARCISNLRQLGMGIQLYADEHRQALPIYLAGKSPDEESPSWWHRRIQGYLDSKFGTAATKPFLCPTDPSPFSNAISYGMNYNLSGLRSGNLSPKVIVLTEVANLTLRGNSADIASLKYNHSEGKTLLVLFGNNAVQSMTNVQDSTATPVTWLP